ncbi:hypothetical protein J8F10_12260 [Gemmata sp. G18]|uniref:Uncharacterized protein n=1 Tax=Gemmata palustris TaxID=2822762 RepID=A0ABS5BQS6_9BACT|nr:hypothetical protein [Gemmata palustris]MBP3956056.1 hypothetical protein [Gemmata palustris]
MPVVETEKSEILELLGVLGANAQKVDVDHHLGYGLLIGSRRIDPFIDQDACVRYLKAIHELVASNKLVERRGIWFLA